MGPTREGRKVVLSGDTEPARRWIAAHQADVLVHEATFIRRRPSARVRPRTDGAPGGRLARDAM